MHNEMSYDQAIWLAAIASILVFVLLIWVIDLRHRMSRLEKRFGIHRKWWNL